MSEWYRFPAYDPGDEIYTGFTEQDARPHVFILKHCRRRGSGDTMPTYGASHAGVADFEKVHAAAEFAVANGLSLDTHVTIKFDLLGLFDAAEIQQELTRFLKCYHAWGQERNYPTAWIYGIEASEDGERHHAHIALHVPGNLKWAGSFPPHEHPRKLFAEWAQGYVKRHFGIAVPRAIRVRFGRDQSIINHWRVVSYLLKGYERMELVQSARTTPDRKPVYLRDLMPWPYANPGKVALKCRFKVSHNLGPKQRAMGLVPEQYHRLPQRFNPAAIQVSLSDDKPTAPSFLPVPRPFRSTFEDGVRDVRYLYPPEFYRIIARQEAFPPPVAPPPPAQCLTCQLRAMAT